MNKADQYTWLGLMSGSSLDGLDVALCHFERTATGQWSGAIQRAQTFPFPHALNEVLRTLPSASAQALAVADADFCRFSAACVAAFLAEAPGHVKPMAIASHGHTVFHQPAAGYTTQIGNGGLLAALTGMPVVADFRTTDVGLGGQGAPLVPGAERFLFGDFDACLNLGGIANISFPRKSPFVGFDIAPCNQLLNAASARLGFAFDAGGRLAAEGALEPALFQQLQSLSFYRKNHPKSLGNEDVARLWMPLLDGCKAEAKDILHTLCLHIGHQIGAVLQQQPGKLLITGGGAFNHHLVGCIGQCVGPQWELEMPDPLMIGFKEAYCFAFLGLKRWLGEVNCFAEVTGARTDSVSGAVYL